MYFETIILMKELEGMLIYNICSSPTRNSLGFCYFPYKFGTHLEKKLIYIKISLVQIFPSN